MSEDLNSKPLVLIVDDDEDIRTYLSVLIHDSAETIEAANGDKGIALAESRLPDLILLDLMMPGTDGYQVCKTLKQNADTRHIPIVFITAQADRTFEAAAMKMGAIDYVVKPFDTDIVSSKVKNYLGMLHQGEQLNTVLRHRRGRHLIWGTVAAVIAGVGGFFAHSYLDLADQESPIVEQSTSAPSPQVRQQPTAPVIQRPPADVSAPVAARPAPPSNVTGAQTTKPPTLAPKEDSLEEARALFDQRHDRTGARDAWVKEAHCGVVPLVDWWQNVSPNSMAKYVEKHHDGVWDGYAAKWRKHLLRTENTMSKGGAMKAPNGTILRGSSLREFVSKLRKRVDVVDCLARAAKRRSSFGE